MKTCSKCGNKLDKSKFYKDKQKKDKLRSWCKVCDNSSCLKYNKTSAGFNTRRRVEMKRKYGLTETAYFKMLKKQNHYCKMCGVHFLDSLPEVDHDHQTGKVRGALCHQCNTALGVIEKALNQNLLVKAVYYIQTEGKMK